ncbi:MAG: ComF family protein [bacterium]|nr:ComF family protein [bacterium]
MWRQALRRVVRGVLDLFYPPLCLLCGADLDHHESLVCSACLARLPLIGPSSCPRCSRPLHSPNGHAHLCGPCRLTARPVLDRVVACGEFRAGLRQLIHLFKYRRCQCLAPLLGNLLAQRCLTTQAYCDLDWLAPIPLHWMRQRWRGFNQARELARYVSLASGIPLLPRSALRRVRRTTPQVRLTAAGRAANVAGAFALSSPHLVRGTRVALVDDVLTTGATSSECARVLLRAGASAVRLFVLAR